MIESLKTRSKRASYLVLLLLLILMTALPVAAYAADNPLRFTVGQVFTTSSATADSTFTYRLKPLDAGNPMPTGSAVEGYSFTITGSASVQTDPISYGKQGVYRYELFQVIATEKPGYTYDRRVYTIEAHVDASLHVEIVVFNKDGTKADGIVFENGYGLLPSDPKLMVDPPVKKTVSGSPSKNSTFTFKLTARDASQPMPAGSANGVKTLTVVGSGEGEFGTWSYTKAGVYYYTVSEVNSGESGYTYDTAVYTITDTVKEEKGQLVLSRVVTNDANKQVTTLTYVNKYSGGGSGGSGGSGPKTGDDRNTTLYIALLALGGALAAGAAVYLIAAWKRKEARRAK